MRLRARTRSFQRAGRALAALEASRRSGLAVVGKLEQCPPTAGRFGGPSFRIVTDEGPVLVNPASAGCDRQTLQALCGLTCEAVGLPRYAGNSVILDALKAYQIDD